MSFPLINNNAKVNSIPPNHEKEPVDRKTDIAISPV